MIIIRKPTKKEKALLGPCIYWCKWCVEDTKNNSIDCCGSFWSAVRLYLWYHGFKTLKK